MDVSFTSARSESKQSIFTKWTDQFNGEQAPLFLDTKNGSGFSPLRSPSRLVTVDGVRCHLRDVYLQQLSNFSNLWSSLLPHSRPQNSDQRSIALFPASRFLVVRSDDGQIIDLSKELISAKTSFHRRFRLAGDIGCGKTSLLYSLVLDWCLDDSELSERYPILLYLRSELAYGRQTLEDVLRGVLPATELKFVMRILSDRGTRSQVLFLLDDCENFIHAFGASSKIGFDDGGDSKWSSYPLDVYRLIKGLLLSETTVVFAERSIDQDILPRRNHISYVVYGLNETISDREFRCRNPLFVTLGSILGKSSDDQDDVLFFGIEKLVTRILAGMKCPTNASYEDCIRILGWLSLINYQDYLPPLTFESRRIVDQKMDSFQRDQTLRDQADELLRVGIDCGLLSVPGTGRLISLSVTDSIPKKRYDYVLAFPHQSFALYLVARTFVTLNLSIDWSQIQNRTKNGHRLLDQLEVALESNERYAFYFLTGVDGKYVHDLVARGLRRADGSDRSWKLPWTVAKLAQGAKPMTAYAEDQFSIIGSRESSDSILLNKLSVFYRSTNDRSLEFHSMVLKEYDFEGSPATRLRLHHCDVYDQFLRLSTHKLFNNLSTIELIDCRFYGVDVTGALAIRLSSISSTLTTLKIIGCQKLAETIDFMRLVGRQLINLDTLQLSNVASNEKSKQAALALAESIGEAKSIKRLALIKNEVADFLFPIMVSHLELVELDLSQCNLDVGWRQFIDLLIKGESPLKKSLISIRLDDNRHLGDTPNLANALGTCDRLKLISVKGCFRTPMEGQRFKEAMGKKNGNGLRRDVLI